METTNGNRKSQHMAEYEAAMREQDAHTLSEAELSVALDELIDRIDSFFAEAALKFEFNLHSNEGEWADEPYLYDLIHRLSPHVAVLQDRLCDATTGQLQSDLLTFAGETRKWAYIVGLFVGVRMSGAPRAQLEKIKKYLVL